LNVKRARHFISVCDQARDACPFFPGGGVRIHRSFPDPAAVPGSEEEKHEAFRRVRDAIDEWIEERFSRRFGSQNF
jgi:arsenate reductase